jgi:hypothetical protein
MACSLRLLFAGFALLSNYLQVIPLFLLAMLMEVANGRSQLPMAEPHTRIHLT